MTGDAEAADLLGTQGTGPLWGMASSDLNATLLAWPAGHELEEHANTERDVLLVALEGGGSVRIDGERQDLSSGHALLIPKGTMRAIRAGDEGRSTLSTPPAAHDVRTPAGAGSGCAA